MSETGNVATYRREDSELNIDNIYSFTDKYDFEIILSGWKKIIIFILNFLTGGFWTILTPFLNEKKKKLRLIFAGIFLGFFQIIHFLHFFSVLTGIKYLEDIYDYISGDQILEKFFSTNKNDNSEKIPFVDDTEINLAEIIAQKSRKKFLKVCFGLIGGLSYSNSFFTTLVNFMKDDPYVINKKLSYKIVLYSFLNPGGGIILSSFALLPNCAEQNIRGIVTSIISILIGIIIIICPFSIGIGVYLQYLNSKMITVFPIKITFLFIGFLGTFISFITSGINRNKIIESIKAIKQPLNAFDIIYKCGKDTFELYSSFDGASFARLIGNIILPGSGTLSLLCKYGCECGIFKIAVMQSIIGGVFFFSIILIIFKKGCTVFNCVDENDLIKEEKYIFTVLFIDYLYTIGLCFYFSGIFLAIITDYMPHRYSDKALIRITVSFILNLFTGGLGTMLNFNFLFKLMSKNEHDCFTICLGYIILSAILEYGGIVCFAGTLFCIFYPNIATKACKIAFPICYSFCVLSAIVYAKDNNITNIGSNPTKKKANNKIKESQIIEICNEKNEKYNN